MQNATCRHILLVYKARHDKAAALADEAAQWLRQKGHDVTAVICAGGDSPAYAAEQIDFVVVLGGDGTMLGVARRLAGRKVPVLGINFGRIGFLTDAQPEHWQEKLEECLTGAEPVRSCLALSWSLTRKGKQIAHGCAVNDVVLSRGSLSRLVLFDVYIAGERLGSLRRQFALIAAIAAGQLVVTAVVFALLMFLSPHDAMLAVVVGASSSLADAGDRLAPDERREKVAYEINRPTFARLKPPLPKICRFIPYSELKKEIEQIGGRIRYMKPEFISEIAESCEPEEA